MRVYIAGPMRGIDKWNFPAFDAAEKHWRESGHEAVSPASMDRSMGINENKEPICSNEFGRRAMAIDIQVLYHSDAIALLPGWANSVGATIELALAQFLGLEVYDANTMEKIRVPNKPWQLIPQHYRSVPCT